MEHNRADDPKYAWGRDLWLKIAAGLIAIFLSIVVVSGAATDSNHEARISVLEAKWNDIDRRLERIDGKIDRLLLGGK